MKKVDIEPEEGQFIATWSTCDGKIWAKTFKKENIMPKELPLETIVTYRYEDGEWIPMIGIWEEYACVYDDMQFFVNV